MAVGIGSSPRTMLSRLVRGSFDFSAYLWRRRGTSVRPGIDIWSAAVSSRVAPQLGQDSAFAGTAVEHHGHIRLAPADLRRGLRRPRPSAGPDAFSVGALVETVVTAEPGNAAERACAGATESGATESGGAESGGAAGRSLFAPASVSTAGPGVSAPFLAVARASASLWINSPPIHRHAAPASSGSPKARPSSSGRSITPTIAIACADHRSWRRGSTATIAAPEGTAVTMAAATKTHNTTAPETP